MRFAYTEVAKADLAWFRLYYRSAFAAGAPSASKQLNRTIANLLSNPYIGHPLDDDEMREYSIPRTPFSIIYRVVDDCIEIARVWDQRGDPEDRGFHEEEQAFA